MAPAKPTQSNGNYVNIYTRSVCPYILALAECWLAFLTRCLATLNLSVEDKIYVNKKLCLTNFWFQTFFGRNLLLLFKPCFHSKQFLFDIVFSQQIYKLTKYYSKKKSVLVYIFVLTQSKFYSVSFKTKTV